jgi:flagellar motility protein MotE (MotC chaperone)
MKSGEAMSKNKQIEKSQSKFQVFFMVILIPAIFAVVLAVVLLYYLGFNVGETIQQAKSMLPFLAEQEQNEEGEVEKLSDEENIAQLEHENQLYVQQIQQLESQIESQERDLENLEEQLFDKQTEELSEEELEEVTADINDIVKTLEEMTSSKAADIIVELPQEQAVTYLRMMRGAIRSDILSRVEPETAAELLTQMSN